MSQINPALPVVGADNDIWGDKANVALAALIAQGNASDTALGRLLPPAGVQAGYVLTADGIGGVAYVPLPQAVTATDVLVAQSRLVGINALGSSYTLVLSDAGKQVEYTGTTAATFTVPVNSAVAFGIGTVISLYLAGTGALTIAGAGGVTVNSPAGFRLTTQYAAASLVQRAPNVWALSGFTVV